MGLAILSEVMNPPETETKPRASGADLLTQAKAEIEEVQPKHRFLVVRAKPDHPDAWLTSRLISDFVPFDFVARYVFNKQGFYRDYENFDRKKRGNVTVPVAVPEGEGDLNIGTITVPIH